MGGKAGQGLQRRLLTSSLLATLPPAILPASQPAGSLGATANAASLALMYAGMVEGSSASLARQYRCWALSQVRRIPGNPGGRRAMRSAVQPVERAPLPPLQVRYMLGDAGRSLVVGFGDSPPERTQDRGAACPDAPEVRGGGWRGRTGVC